MNPNDKKDGLQRQRKMLANYNICIKKKRRKSESNKPQNIFSMKAVILQEYGSSLKVSKVTKPIPAPGQVLVRIQASGTNPLDVKIRLGKAPHAKTQLPAILGLDLAGTIESVAPGVTEFAEGDQVFGMTGGVGGVQGSLAEYAAVDAKLLALKPKNFSMREAAATPLIFITAWEGLVDRARVQSGWKVLIHGGAGGVGHMAVQIALASGAEVFTTVSNKDMQTVERLGAVPIDYKVTPVEQYVNGFTGGEGFDIVYDTVGGEVLDHSFQAVKKYTGHVVSCLGWGTHNLAPLSFRCATYSGVFSLLPLLSGSGRSHQGEILRKAVHLAETGKLHVFLDHRQFNLDSIHDAHDVLEGRKNTGKVVIDID
jgi:NADPH:quinone reductase-like Zn-dependent oxidoreductase